MNSPTYGTLLVERRGKVDWLTLNRPEALNAFSLQLVADLHAYFDRIHHDRSVHVVVVRGAGRAFCAGLDIKESASGAHKTDAPFAGGFGLQSHLSDLCIKMRRCPQPIIALVHGAACGGGLGLALAADIRIGGESLRMGVAAIRLGLSGCDMGMSYHLPRLVGASVAAELLLTGRFMNADRALRTGLISEVAPDDRLEAVGQTYVDDMLAASPVGLRLTKEGLNLAIDAPSLEAALAIENRSQMLAGRSDDFAEGRRAFLEKRKPVYTNS